MLHDVPRCDASIGARLEVQVGQNQKAERRKNPERTVVAGTVQKTRSGARW